MVVSGFGPYHHLVRADAPAERAGVILTPWVMPRALGLGAILHWQCNRLCSTDQHTDP